MPNDFFLGVDLGLRRDNSAIVVIERSVRPQAVRNPVTWEWDRHDEIRLAITHAERIPLGTPFPQVTRRAALLARACSARAGKSLLAMDATGLGVPIVGMMRAEDTGKCYPLPVMITDGHHQHHSDGLYMVPKQDLIAGLAAVLETRLLCAAKGVDLGPLIEEMRTFGVRLRPSGSSDYSGKKDDLVIALCLAVWASRLADLGHRPGVIPGMPGKNDWI